MSAARDRLGGTQGATASPRAARRAARRSASALPSASALVGQLERSRRSFDAAAVAATSTALEDLSRLDAVPPQLLRRLHDVLLFIAAHPPDAQVHDRAERELARIAAHVGRLGRRGEALVENSGLPGSTLATTFSLALTGRLTARHADDIALLSVDGDHDFVMAALATALDPMEQEALSEEALPWSLWLARYAGSEARRRLHWLVRIAAATPASAPLRESMFAACRVFVRWRLRGAATLATGRIGRAPLFFHTALERVPALRARDLAAPVTRVAMSKRERAALTATAQDVLATLLRETDPITYAATAETERHDLGRGLQIALFFMQPGHKLALETYACYLLFKNGIPVAYGGGWSLGPQCRFGVNVLPPFRGGESTLLVAALLRVYAQRFAARVFAVEPYQIGKGNADGIRSASFWFYYRLGFRPVQEELAALAAREHARLASGTRTAVPLLRALAESLLVFRIDPRDRWSYVAPAALGLAVTRHVETRYAGDRELARRSALSALARSLPRGARLPPGLAGWALLLDAGGGTAGWSADDIRALVGLARRKPIAEADFACRLEDHTRLMGLIRSLAARRAV